VQTLDIKSVFRSCLLAVLSWKRTKMLQIQSLQTNSTTHNIIFQPSIKTYFFSPFRLPFYRFNKFVLSNSENKWKKILCHKKHVKSKFLNENIVFDQPNLNIVTRIFEQNKAYKNQPTHTTVFQVFQVLHTHTSLNSESQTFFLSH